MTALKKGKMMAEAENKEKENRGDHRNVRIVIKRVIFSKNALSLGNRFVIIARR